MIVLRSAELLAVVDPVHGAEVVEPIDIASGARMLGTPPFPPGPPRAGDLDEDAWTAAYRGGWQVVAPNAGNACTVDGDGDQRVLPHVWVWHEMRASGGLWRGQAELLGIEPASVPHSLGLERAIAEQQAVRVDPGPGLRTRTRLTVRPPAVLDASPTAR